VPPAPTATSVPVGTIQARAVWVDPIDTSCTAVRAVPTTDGYITGTAIGFTPSSASQPAAQYQVGAVYEEFANIVTGSYTMDIVPPTADWAYTRSCWTNVTTGAVGEGRTRLPCYNSRHTRSTGDHCMPENNELEKTLWQAADKMRSNMDAAEYKHVVLGLIFLKYISDAFNDMHAKLAAGGGEFEGANPEDPDEYLANNVFFVPELSRWGAGRAIEVKQPQVAEIFSNRVSHSQMFTGDLGFGSRAGRANNIEVTYRGKSVAAIPSSSFGQPQGGFDQAPVLQTNSHRERQTVKTNHKARQREQWVAKSGSKAKENRAVEALNTRMQMAAITSQTEAPGTEPLLPFGTFEEVSPVAYAALLPFGKFNKRRAALLLSLSALLASCAAPATAPVIVMETRPAPAITAPAIATETPPPPIDIASVHPDFHDTDIFSQVPFSPGATPDQLTAANPLGLPTYALDAYSQNIEAIQAKVTGEQGAKVFWSADYSKKFVLLTRVNGGVTEVAVIAAGADNISYHPNAEWFDFTPAEAPKYIWVALPGGYTADSLIGGYKGEYPVWGVSDAEQMPAAVYAPGSDAQFVENPAIVQPFAIESLTLAPEQAAAMKAHRGLEASITAEAEGTFSTSVQILHTQGQPVTETMQVDPNTLHEDLNSKNEFGDTPVMITVDGKKLYWIQEEGGWVSVEISTDSQKPVLIPLGKSEIVTRIAIVEFPEDFSQASVERWKNKTASHALLFESREVNANTGERTRFGFITNRTLADQDLTYDNSPVKNIDAWFAMILPDGTKFEFFPTKWLDPKNPRDPQGDEWKIILCAMGTEISDNPQNLDQFERDLNESRGNAPVRYVIPIIKAQNGFFNNPNLPTALPINQPSLAKLLTYLGNSFAKLKIPIASEWDMTYESWINYNWDRVNKENPSVGSSPEIGDPQYDDEFFSPDTQTLIFPAFVMRR